jgi:hypothetical protein
MWLPSGPVLFGALALLLFAHVTVTYCASERLNVFTAMLMLSLLPALALGLLAGAITAFVADDGATGLRVGVGVFALLVVPYTGQELWKLLARRDASGNERKPGAPDRATDSRAS